MVEGLVFHLKRVCVIKILILWAISSILFILFSLTLNRFFFLPLLFHFFLALQTQDEGHRGCVERKVHMERERKKKDEYKLSLKLLELLVLLRRICVCGEMVNEE